MLVGLQRQGKLLFKIKLKNVLQRGAKPTRGIHVEGHGLIMPFCGVDLDSYT